LGALDVIVHNAGISAEGSAADAELERGRRGWPPT
jgi:hypothetical protein